MDTSHEYQLELNPSDAHISIRCTSQASAEEYARRLFPNSQMKHTDGATFINEKDGDIVGVISKLSVPSQWANSRNNKTRRVA